MAVTNARPNSQTHHPVYQTGQSGTIRYLVASALTVVALVLAPVALILAAGALWS